MVVLSICSAVGQLFIYHTIDVFGPVVFTIIMTLRQVSGMVFGSVFTQLCSHEECVFSFHRPWPLCSRASSTSTVFRCWASLVS